VAAKAEASGQQDKLADSLAELFTNLSVMVRGELQVPPMVNKFGEFYRNSTDSVPTEFQNQ
jgi:hypothetical protein